MSKRKQPANGKRRPIRAPALSTAGAIAKSPAVRPKKPDAPAVAGAKANESGKQADKQSNSGPKSLPGAPSGSKPQSPPSKQPPPTGPLSRGARPVLPHQPPSRALGSIRRPNMKGDPSKVMNSRLKKRSPWYASILDPLHGADAKIPDETGLETGTVQLVQRYALDTNANGIAGLRIISPYVNKVTSGTQIDLGQNIQTCSPTATTITIDWGSANDITTNWTAGAGEPFSGVNELQAVTNSHRIVSAALYVQPEPSLATNSGEITLFMRPFQTDGTPIYTDYVNYYKSVVIPLSAVSEKAAVVRWVPMVREDWSFKAFVSTIAYAFNDADSTDNSVPYWELGCLALTEPDVTIRFTVVVNYEFVPTFNTLNVVDAAPSPQDATEVDLVENWVQEMPVAETVATNRASSSPETVSPQHGENDDGSGFGMFYNVVKELAPYALGILGVL